ncbi:hypothetical protein [Streptomyces collinus]
MSAGLLLAGVGGAVLGVVLPAAVWGVLERALPSLSVSGDGRAKAAVAAVESLPRGVR